AISRAFPTRSSGRNGSFAPSRTSRGPTARSSWRWRRAYRFAPRWSRIRSMTRTRRSAVYATAVSVAPPCSSHPVELPYPIRRPHEAVRVLGYLLDAASGRTPVRERLPGSEEGGARARGRQVVRPHDSAGQSVQQDARTRGGQAADRELDGPGTRDRRRRGDPRLQADRGVGAAQRRRRRSRYELALGRRRQPLADGEL